MTEEFDKEEFSKLAFPIHGVENIFEKFPKLRQLFPEEDLVGLDTQSVVKYIIYVYDKESPLVKKIESIASRKAMGAHLAGFPNENGEFSEQVVQMLRCSVKQINNMTIRYCRQMKSRLYSIITVSSESLNGTMEEILGYKVDKDSVLEDNKKKIELIGKAQELANKLDDWSRELLSQDTNQELVEQLYTLVDESDLMLSPEENADKGEDG